VIMVSFVELGLDICAVRQLVVHMCEEIVH
jgi:hypothetical protein